MFLKLNIKDNVGIYLGGNKIFCMNNKKHTISIKIPYGHKFALKNITKNKFIIKYGEIIGRAKKDIKIGAHVHIHNMN